MPKSDAALCRKRLDFATKLQLFGRQHAPDAMTEGITLKAATKIRRDFGTSDQWKRERILAWMKTDPAGESVSQAETMDYFGWRQQLVSQLFTDLLDEFPPRIEMTRHRGTGPGRPMIRYRLLKR